MQVYPNHSLINELISQLSSQSEMIRDSELDLKQRYFHATGNTTDIRFVREINRLLRMYAKDRAQITSLQQWRLTDLYFNSISRRYSLLQLKPGKERPYTWFDICESVKNKIPHLEFTASSHDTSGRSIVSLCSTSSSFDGTSQIFHVKFIAENVPGSRGPVEGYTAIPRGTQARPIQKASYLDELDGTVTTYFVDPSAPIVFRLAGFKIASLARREKQKDFIRKLHENNAIAKLIKTLD